MFIKIFISIFFLPFFKLSNLETIFFCKNQHFDKKGKKKKKTLPSLNFLVEIISDVVWKPRFFWIIKVSIKKNKKQNDLEKNILRKCCSSCSSYSKFELLGLSWQDISQSLKLTIFSNGCSLKNYGYLEMYTSERVRLP